MKKASDFENIVLTAAEKKTFRKVRRHPGITLTREESRDLFVLGLISPETDGVDAFNNPIRTDRYRVNTEGRRYLEYVRQTRRDLMLKSLWLPILVSLITSGLFNLFVSLFRTF